MAPKRPNKSRTDKNSPNQAKWLRLLLALTLVPLIIGVLLIGAWALDIYIWEPPENQVVLAVLFILLSFVTSNALQKRWQASIAWLFMLVADWVLLTSYNVTFQIGAFILVGIGVILLGIEFYRRWQQQKQSGARKKV
jgi:membrane-bound ClpP family serine protease